MNVHKQKLPFQFNISLFIYYHYVCITYVLMEYRIHMGKTFYIYMFVFHLIHLHLHYCTYFIVFDIIVIICYDLVSLLSQS